MDNIDERWKAIFAAIGVIIVNAAALLGIDIGDGVGIQDAMLALAWIASLAWAVWHNFNFTHAAQEGERVIKAIKAAKKETGMNLSAECSLELTDGKGDDDDV